MVSNTFLIGETETSEPTLYQDENSKRFFKILLPAMRRNRDASRYFEMKKQAAVEPGEQSFFSHLMEKKSEQYDFLKKIASNMDMTRNDAILLNEISHPSDNHWDIVNYPPYEKMANLYSFVYEKTVDELDFYLNFAIIEKDKRINSLLYTLANLTKDFLFEIRIGHLNFLYEDIHFSKTYD